MAIHLVVCEHDGKAVRKPVLHVIEAMRRIPGETHALLMGTDLAAVAQSIAPYLQKVHVAEHPALEHPLSQTYAQVAADAAKALQATHVWAAASVFGKETMPRVAVRLEAGMASDIQVVVDEQTFQRPLWAGNVIGTIRLETPVKVCTVRTTDFQVAKPLQGNGEITSFAATPDQPKMRFVAFEQVVSERPELTEAKVVVSGGRGLKGADGFKQLVEPLADALGAAIGASRAVCDAGWVPNDWQVGQTGKVVAPELYIAVGISGAIQHVAGIKGSKVIVAINKDPEAPIFQIADYGLVADAFTAVPELLKAIQNDRIAK